MNNNSTRKKEVVNYIFMAVTFAGLVLTAVIFRQRFIKLLPCLISLSVMLLQSRANRYGFLLGGLNSLLYAVGYYMLGLYSSMAYAVVFSFPMQTATFIRWSRRPYKKSTVMRRAGAKARATAAAVFIVLWTVCYFVLRYFGSSYILFDNTVTLLGTAVTFLTLFAFLEANYISALCAAVNLVMFIVKSFKEPENITYVIYQVYALIRVIEALINWKRIYTEQQSIKT
jgi:nicotinamide riboside transporter PnuC